MTIKLSGWYADMFNVKPSLWRMIDLDQSRVQGLGTHFFDELLPWFWLKYSMKQVHFMVSRMIMMISGQNTAGRKWLFFSSHAAALHKLSLNTSLEKHQQTCQLDCTWLYYVLVQICCTTWRAAVRKKNGESCEHPGPRLSSWLATADHSPRPQAVAWLWPTGSAWRCHAIFMGQVIPLTKMMA